VSEDNKGNAVTKVYDKAGRLKYVVDDELASGSSISSVDSTKLTEYDYYDNGGLDIDNKLIRYALTDNVKTYDVNTKWEQISLFPMIDKIPTANDNFMSITGEI
jgi:hypothetical protein